MDYYKILGVSRDALQSDIKKAYRKLARKFHPDLNPNDSAAEQKFKEINEANEVLGNEENRKKYDEYGKDWKHAEEIEKARQQQSYQSQQRQYQRYSGGYQETDFSDFFQDMFGGGGGFQSSRTRSQFRGADFNAELSLQLTDILADQTQVLTVNGNKIRLTIPAGVEDGQTIKIKGQGGKGSNGGPHGDLYITFTIQNSTAFKREGSDLFLNFEIDLFTAILGGEVLIDTLEGKVKLKVPPGTQNNTKVRLKGKGMPLYKKQGNGDLIVSYQVKIPTKLSVQERELFQQLKSMSNG